MKGNLLSLGHRVSTNLRQHKIESLLLLDVINHTICLPRYSESIFKSAHGRNKQRALSDEIHHAIKHSLPAASSALEPAGVELSEPLALLGKSLECSKYKKLRNPSNVCKVSGV